jgi:hypothetical protein
VNIMQTAFGRTLHLAAMCGVVAICSTVAAQDIPVQSASRPAPRGDDEIIVYGSISELRRQMLVTRDVMFTRFNEINSDDKFDIHCYSEGAERGRIKRERCVPNYQRQLEGGYAQAFLGQILGQAGIPPGAYWGEMTFWNNKLSEEWLRLAHEDPEFKKTMQRFGTARTALGRVTPSFFSSSRDVTPHGTTSLDGAQRVLDVSIGRRPWRHTFDSSTFTIVAAGGTIQGLTVMCDNATETLEYAPDSEWTVPTDYGRCRLQVDATPGTSLTLYEYPGSP